MHMSAEGRKDYFTETAIVLRREGYEVEWAEDERLCVQWDGKPLCEVKRVGGIIYRREDLSDEAQLSAKERAYEIVRMTAEYMRQFENAPVLNVPGLKDRYRMLADFNGTVLGAMNSKFGVQFATWDWDFDRRGVSHGHYFTHNYEAVKEDFATRSGLIPISALFSEKQMTAIYQCCADALQNGLDMSYEQEQTIKGIQEQIERCLPDVAQSMQPSQCQEQTM